MKAAVVRALFLDALYQVLDSMVFRILGIIVFLLIASTFVVGWKNDGIWILFGAWKLGYVELLGPFLPDGGASFNELDVDLQRRVVDGVQGVFIEGLSGTLGIALCIAATAFFMPRMLERGTVDTLFTKPVSRVALYLARYFSGILFVALLAIVLVSGMHLGFLTASGYSDPGFLWGALTLVYVFALIHGVSVMVGALTRSSVAAILITLIFFTFTGCTHGFWIKKEWDQSREDRTQEPADEANETTDLPAREQEERSIQVRILDTLHYGLPKTTDAGFLTKKMRSSFERRPEAFDDPHGVVSMRRGPSPVEGLEFERDGAPRSDEWLGQVRWVARDTQGSEEATIELTRENSVFLPPTAPGGAPVRRERSLSRIRVSRELEKDLRARLGTDSGLTTWRTDTGVLPHSVVTWAEDGTAHEVHFFGWEDQFYRVEFTWSESVPPETREAVVDDFGEVMEMPEVDKLQQESELGNWYEEQLGLDAPLRFNIFFSIGSSLLFLIVVLSIGAWRLLRADF